MKTLFFTQLFPNSSSQVTGIFNLSRANALRRLGHTVQVIAPIGLTPPERLFFPYPKVNSIISYVKERLSISWKEKITGFLVYHPRWLSLPHKYFWVYDADLLHFFAGRKINKIIREFEPDIIITSWLHPYGTYAKFIKKKVNIPIISYAEGSDIFIWPDIYPGWSNIKMLLERYVDRVILISNAMYQLNFQKRKIKNTKLIVDGYDEDIFYYFHKIQNKDYVNILSIGNLSVVKGHDILIKSLGYLGSNFSLNIIGDGPEKEKLINYVKSYNLQSRVNFIGQINHEHLRSFIEKSDIFCMPSRSDAQPAAALEAMACGRPVVATNVGGFPYLIEPGFNGYLAEPESPESLAYYIEKAFATKWDYKAIAEWTKENFGWEKSITQLLKVINEEIRKYKGDFE